MFRNSNIQIFKCPEIQMSQIFKCPVDLNIAL